VEGNICKYSLQSSSKDIYSSRRRAFMAKLQPFLQPLILCFFSRFLASLFTDTQAMIAKCAALDIHHHKLTSTQVCTDLLHSVQVPGNHSKCVPYNSLCYANYLIVYGSLKTDPAPRPILLKVKIYFHREVTKCYSRQVVEGVSCSRCHHHQNQVVQGLDESTELYFVMGDVASKFVNVTMPFKNRYATFQAGRPQ